MLNKIFKKSLTIVIAAVLLVGARSVFAIQSVGNIDDSYQIESVTRTIDGKLYAWNSKGEQVDNWPIDLSGSGRTFILEPRLMDLDKDGRMEILVISQGADNSMRLHVYTGLARELSKWSRDLSLGESRLVSTPIISDINNDNQLETIYSTNNNQIHVLKEDGNDLDSFTYPETTSFFQIAVAGLFNKGKDQLYAINGSVIFVWDVNPDRSISFLSFFVTPDRGNIIGELVSYDMNADGYNELIFATTNNHIYVVDQNGGVTQSISVVGEMPLSTQIAVGDVNLDGKPDILGLLTNGTRVAYSADGTSLNNWLAEAGYREYSSSSIGKIVDDLYNGAFSSGKGWDLFITYFTNLYNFAVFELGENIHEYDRNTEFYYARAARISNIAAMPLVFTPNGDSVNDQTELHFDLSDNAMITVDLLNSNKQFISNLIHDKEVDKGHVREVWDGINHQGTRTEEDDNPLDSGVYVLRVSARSKQGLISESLTQAVLFGIKAQIEFPEENVQVWQTIAIRGIAADPNIGENSSGFDYQSYKLYYRHGTWEVTDADISTVGEAGSEWEPISVPLRLQSPTNIHNEGGDANYPNSNVGVSPVQHGVLGTWDTRDVSDGLYTILLKVIDEESTGENHYSYDFVYVNVVNHRDLLSAEGGSGEGAAGGSGDPGGGGPGEEGGSVLPTPILKNITPTHSTITERVSRANISYELLDKPSDINVTIYNESKVVYSQTFLNRASERTYSFVWNGQDNFGRALPNGAYNVLLTATAIDGYGEDKDTSASITVDIENSIAEGLQLINFASSVAEFNPLNSSDDLPDRSTTITYALNKLARVTLEIFNSDGVLKKRLLTNHLSQVSGDNPPVWDGTDADGLILPFGNYICRLTAIGTEVGRDESLVQERPIRLASPDYNDGLRAIINRVVGDGKSSPRNDRERGILVNNDNSDDDYPLQGNPDFYWNASGTGDVVVDMQYNMSAYGDERYIDTHTETNSEDANPFLEMRCNSLLKVVCYPVGESSGIIVLKNECPDPIYKVVCNVGEGYDELDFTLTEATSQYAIEINLYDGNHNVVRSFTTSDRNPEISIGGNYRFENVRDVYYASYTFKRRDTVRTCSGGCACKSVGCCDDWCDTHYTVEPEDPAQVIVRGQFTRRRDVEVPRTESWSSGPIGWSSPALFGSGSYSMGRYPSGTGFIGTGGQLISQNFRFEARERLNNSYRNASFGACNNGYKDLPFARVWMGNAGGPDTTDCISHSPNMYINVTQPLFSTTQDTRLSNGKIKSLFANFNESDYKLISNPITIYDSYPSGVHPDLYTFSNAIRIRNWNVELEYPNGDAVQAFEVINKQIHGDSPTIDQDNNGIPDFNANISDTFQLKMKPNAVPRRFIEIRGNVDTTDYELKYYDARHNLWIDIPARLSSVVHEDGTRTLGWWDVTQLNGRSFTVLLQVKNDRDEINEDTMNIGIGTEVRPGEETVVADAFGRAKFYFDERSLMGDSAVVLVTATPVPNNDPLLPMLHLPAGNIPVGPVYNLQPDDIAINPAYPVQMEITYTCEEVWNAFGGNPAEMTVYNLKDNGELEIISTLNPTADSCDTPDPNKFFVITAMLEHFSNYVILKENGDIPSFILDAPQSNEVYTTPLQIAGRISGPDLESFTVRYYDGETVAGDGVVIFEGTENSFDFNWEASVPSGTYTLVLKAINIEGFENSLTIPIQLDIDPPLTRIMVDDKVVFEGQSAFVTEDNIISFVANDETNSTTSDVTRIQYKIDAGGYLEYIAPFTLAGLDIGNHEVAYTAFDKAGNQEPERRVTLILRDDSIPMDETELDTKLVIEGPVYELEDEVWTSQDSNFVIGATSANQMLSFISYRLTEEQFVTYQSPISLKGLLEGVYLIEYFGTDIYERDEQAHEFRFIMDSTLPSTMISIDGHHQEQGEDILVSKDAEIALTAQDQGFLPSGVQKVEYRFDEGDWEIYTKPISLAGRSSLGLEYRSIDNVGNKEDAKTKNLVFDNNAPTLTLISADTAFSPNHDKINDEMKVVVNVTDQFSSIHYFTLLIDGQTVYADQSIGSGDQTIVWDGHVDGVLLSNDIYLYELYVSDEAGNRSNSITGEVALDTVEPNLAILDEGSFISGARGLSVNYSLEDNLATRDLRVDIDIAGVEGGLLATQHDIVNLPPNEKSLSWNGQNAVNNVLPDGGYLLQIKATDPAGNQSELSQKTLFFDATPPLTLLKFVGGSKNGWVSANTNILLEAIDYASGVLSTYYRLGDSQASTLYHSPFSLTTSGTQQLVFWSIDKAGNQETEKAATLNVDVTKPVSEHTWEGIHRIVDGKDHISGSKTKLLLSAEDEHSGLDKIWCKIDSNNVVAWTVPILFHDMGDGLHQFTYWSVDNVGNIEEAKTIDFILHGHPPIFDLSFGTPQYQINDSLYITSATPIKLLASSDKPDITLVEYRINSGETTRFTLENAKSFTTPDFTVPDERNNTIYGNVSDDYENAYSASRSVIVDNSPPQTKITQSQEIPGDVNFVSPSTSYSLSAQDNLVGVKEIMYKIDNAIWSTYAGTFDLMSFSDGEHKIYYKSTDLLSNQENVNTQRVDAISIDAGLSQSDAPRILVYDLDESNSLVEFLNIGDISSQSLLFLMEIFETKHWHYKFVTSSREFLEDLRGDEFDLVMILTDQENFVIEGNDFNTKLFGELTERIHNGLTFMAINPTETIDGVPWDTMWQQFIFSGSNISSDRFVSTFYVLGKGRIISFGENPAVLANGLSEDEKDILKEEFIELLRTYKGIDSNNSPLEVVGLDIVLTNKDRPVNIGANAYMPEGVALIKALATERDSSWVVDLKPNETHRLRYITRLPAAKTDLKFNADTLTTWDSGLTYDLHISTNLEMSNGWQFFWNEAINKLERLAFDDKLPDGAWALVNQLINQFNAINEDDPDNYEARIDLILNCVWNLKVLEGIQDINDLRFDLDEALEGLALLTTEAGQMPSFSTTAVDSDGDGLSDDIEDAAGLDRLDMDTDDDGVIDGMERGALIDSDEDGLINALDTDSDNDGLSDGLEMGLTEISEDPDGFGPIKSTNVEKGAVVMDTDSATTTNMTLKDTDGGGLMDNEEDANLNGKMDIGETDPNNPNDDTNPTFATGGGGGGGCVLVAEASSFDITFMIMLFVFLIFCICYPSKAFKRGSIFLSGGSVKTEEDMK